jgi:exocyst complex protein 7
MEEIYRLQQSYAVPDAELRATLRYESRNNIYPKYKEFYDKYAGVSFTKNPEKYIKHTPESIATLIDSFFDVS